MYFFLYLFQNQTANRTLNHANSLANVIGQSAMPVLAQYNNHNSNNHHHHNNNNNNNSMATNQKSQQSTNSSGNSSPNNHNNNIMYQHQINQAAAAMVAQHQQQQHQKLLLHTALTRAVSNPNNGNNVVSLVNSLIENLGHRKLERTQSEPLPQVNTSR